MTDIEKMIREEHHEFFTKTAEKRKTSKSEIGKKLIDNLEKRYIQDVKDEISRMMK